MDGVDLFPNALVWIQRDEHQFYMYENLDRRAPIAQTFDADANLAAQDRMRTIATDPRLIVPGHDPAVFQRFALAAPGVASIR